jgi:predicted O-linked N-acetylglucosamine transferase (SPINDLY family)
MLMLEPAAFALDSFPYGGVTSIIDALYLRRPIVVWDGWQFYNRAGAEILRRVGLDDLVATDEDSYVRIAVDLLRDDAFRARIAGKLASVDIVEHLPNLSSKSAFADAIDYLACNHEALRGRQDRTPLYFE